MMCKSVKCLSACVLYHFIGEKVETEEKITMFMGVSIKTGTLWDSPVDTQSFFVHA